MTEVVPNPAASAPAAPSAPAIPTPNPAIPPASATNGGQPAASPNPPPGSPDPGIRHTALAAGAEWSFDTVPEKYRVKNEAGEWDHVATLRKVDEHRAALERRLGSGDHIRPKSPEEYKLPETFKDLPLDEAATAKFRAEAHEMGLSQTQYEAVLNKWKDLAPELVGAAKKDSTETTIAALREHWKDGFDAELRGAHRAVNALAQKAGLTYDEVDAAIGNNPAAIRMFAALSKEMTEDRTPTSANGGMSGGAASFNQYIAENWAAYSNPGDPKHQMVVARALELSRRENPEPPK